MKANELRIGNLVYFNHCDYDIFTPMKINYTQNPNLLGLEMVTVNRIEYNNIKPIPLTNEYLFKLGFEKISGWDDQVYYREKDWRKKGYSFFELQLNNKGFIFTDFNNIIIESVHQLQNLFFALTNNELTL